MPAAILGRRSAQSMCSPRLVEGAEILVVHSGEHRSLDRTPYAARRAECEQAAHILTVGAAVDFVLASDGRGPEPSAAASQGTDPE